MNCGLKGALHSQLGLFLLLQQFFLFLKGFPVFVKTVVHRFTTAATIANALAADALALRGGECEAALLQAILRV